MYPILRPLLNRGGAGRSLSRAETVEALNPLVRRHQELILAYDAAVRALPAAAATQVEPVMNRLRTELAKLREEIASNGGTPPSGVGLPTPALGRTESELVHGLDARERAYRDALKETLEYPHYQMRTLAILENQLKGSEARLGALHPLVTRTRRPGGPPAEAPTDSVTGKRADIPTAEHHAGPDEQPMIREDRG